jgi:hypothetical protein
MITETYLAELRDYYKSDPSFDFNSAANILEAADRRDPAMEKMQLQKIGGFCHPHPYW